MPLPFMRPTPLLESLACLQHTATLLGSFQHDPETFFSHKAAIARVRAFCVHRLLGGLTCAA